MALRLQHAGIAGTSGEASMAQATVRRRTLSSSLSRERPEGPEGRSRRM